VGEEGRWSPCGRPELGLARGRRKEGKKRSTEEE